MFQAATVMERGLPNALEAEGKYIILSSSTGELRFERDCIMWLEQVRQLEIRHVIWYWKFAGFRKYGEKRWLKKLK